MDRAPWLLATVALFCLIHMDLISDIQPQKRNQQRVNIYVGGQYAFSLSLTAAAELKIGQPLTPELLAQVRSQDEFDKARLTAERFLSYRPRSTAEVRQNLLRKEIPVPLVEQVIRNLQERHLLDDVAFARYWIEQRESFKPRGALALRQELQQKGLEQHIIEAVLTRLDDTSSARRAAEKQAQRWSHLPWEAFSQKMGSFLQRRGFDYDTIRQVTRAVWQAQAADEPE